MFRPERMHGPSHVLGCQVGDAHTAVEAAILEARRWVRIQQGTKTEHE
jgi:hypothetical protein